jgi:predicted dehydrogenase
LRNASDRILGSVIAWLNGINEKGEQAMSITPIRIGIVGAGSNVRLRHVPGFKAIEGVELVSVCNRSRESSKRAAAEFGIPNIYDNWLDLVEADDTDAICIGTWPYLHCQITLAALENNKHVLTEARMAMNAQEAKVMLEVSRSLPHLVSQVVPAPFTLEVDRTIQDMIANGYLGNLHAVEVSIASSEFADLDGRLTWRQDWGLSGYNALTLGIWYEALLRWIGPATKVMAMTKTAVTQRLDFNERMHPILIPDHIDIICQMACGAQTHMRFSSIIGLAPKGQVWLHGSDGTIRLDTDSLDLHIGKRGDSQLTKVSIDPSKTGFWRVEEEFVNAIRGIEQITHTTFETGLQYMEFTEAVARSAQTGKAVSLPL